MRSMKTKHADKPSQLSVQDAEWLGLRRGYYLVKNGERHFVSETVSESALNRVCNRVLSESKGWDYWIDYSHGPDVFGNPAWANIDQTDRFI